MGLGQTILLGAIAAVTIVLGMPVGRLRGPAPALRVLLNAVAIGVLLFLVWDVLSAAWEPIDAALADVSHGRGGLPGAVGYGALFAGGLTVGLLSLVGYERWLTRAKTAAPRPVVRFGPGAMATAEARSRRGVAAWAPARRLALLIAVGIGLHNFAEGLAIGQSAAAGELGLATVLVVGFALHNATEGFGIVAPLAAADPDRVASERPSWAFLLALAAHRWRPDPGRDRSRARLHQRTHRRRVPHPRRRIDHLRHSPAPRGGQPQPAPRPDLHRAPGRATHRVPHRRDRHRRRSLDLDQQIGPGSQARTRMTSPGRYRASQMHRPLRTQVLGQ